MKSEMPAGFLRKPIGSLVYKNLVVNLEMKSRRRSPKSLTWDTRASFSSTKCAVFRTRNLLAWHLLVLIQTSLVTFLPKPSFTTASRCQKTIMPIE